MYLQILYEQNLLALTMSMSSCKIQLTTSRTTTGLYGTSLSYYMNLNSYTFKGTVKQ